MKIINMKRILNISLAIVASLIVDGSHNKVLPCGLNFAVTMMIEMKSKLVTGAHYLKKFYLLTSPA